MVQSELKEFVIELQPDYIFHLAAYGNKYHQEDFDQMIQANILGTTNLLKASQSVSYQAFINVGSSSEYGIKPRAMKEEDSLDSDTFYGVTKASASLLCRAFAKQFNKPIITARPFSLYGPGDDPNKFILTAIRSFKENQELNLAYGFHDWIYIDDFIDALLLLVGKAPELVGKAVNIGTGIQSSNHTVISILRGIFNKPGKIHKIEKMRNYDTEVWVADINFLKSLGWQPQFSLEEGLERTIYEDSK